MSSDVLLVSNNRLEIKLSRLGGALLEGRYCGIPFLHPSRTEGLASRVFGAEASFPMVPFGNRLEGNRFKLNERVFVLEPNTPDPFYIHGDGWLAGWQILSVEPSSTMLSYSHRSNGAGGYAYDAAQEVSLDGDMLSLTLAVTNRSSETLPYGLGHHPFFPRTPHTLLWARAAHFWSERSGHLPGFAGRIPDELDFTEGKPLPSHWLNNAFDGWDGWAKIEWPELGLSATIEAQEPLRHFMLYSPGESAGYFCFEPMTHLPNGHHLEGLGALRLLQPGESLSTRMTLTLAA